MKNNIGMHLHKLIKKELTINYAILDKHRPTNGLVNQQKLKDR